MVVTFSGFLAVLPPGLEISVLQEIPSAMVAGAVMYFFDSLLIAAIILTLHLGTFLDRSCWVNLETYLFSFPWKGYTGHDDGPGDLR